MLHFEIQTNRNNYIYNNLYISKNEHEYYEYLNASCYKYLKQTKELIEDNNKGWDIFKKVTNPYEYIHTNINNIRVSKLKPLSRAFYKMIEIIHFFNLNNNHKDVLNTFHIAEGPGGFIEAINYYRKHNCNPYIYHKDKYYGMTLVDDKDDKIPGWSKAQNFINTNKNVHLEYGKTNDGDIYKLDNLDYIYENHRNKYSIVTGDGGFDFSSNFNKQESMALKLILCEILYGIILTKKGGHFVVKIFDLFTTCSYEIIFLLSCIFEDVYICKPDTSRYGNSEKYIVCKNKYSDINDSTYSIIRAIFIQIHSFTEDFQKISILNIRVPVHIKNTLQEINCVFTERQLSNINSTLSIINNNKKNELVNEMNNKHVQSCIEWCIAHGIPYKDDSKQNIFS